MKAISFLLGLSAALTVNQLSAQVEVTITGSTAFRAITIDRVASLYDNGYTAVTNNASTGLQTYRGTMAGAIPSLQSTPVTIRLSFSGSAAGMQAVQAGTPISTAESQGVNTNKTPDLSLSDVFPESATPPLRLSDFDHFIVGVVPFVFVRNSALAGITNITREQAILLMTASGVTTNGTDLYLGMPASFLGGTGNNPVYLIGRDSGSGTRITTFKDIGFVGTDPTQWALDANNNYVLTNGFSSGGLERAVIGTKPDAIGYLGLADYRVIATNAVALSFNGVPFSHANVTHGSYALWGYEHLVNRTGGLSSNQRFVRDALINAITATSFQGTSPLYTNSFTSFSEMQVERGADGGTITSKNF
jgi:ABC-type phosphate transport system substrate-binding protein